MMDMDGELQCGKVQGMKTIIICGNEIGYVG